MELKPSLRLMWRNTPALETVDLVAGTPPTPTGESVTDELEKLDTIFTLAFVIKFQPDE
jgi:hypothetical protein